MRYRNLGSTSVRVSEVALGTGDNAGGIIYGTATEQLALVAGALELGVTLFDTSPDYGKGLAESNLGRALARLSVPSQALIVTKVEIMPEHLGQLGERVLQSAHESLQRLQRDYIDILMLHNPCRPTRNRSIRTWTPLTPVDVLQEILPAFIHLRTQGKIRHFGLACDNSADPASVRTVLQCREFALINAVYNLLNPSAARPASWVGEDENYSGLFAAASAHGTGIGVIRCLAGGALAGQVARLGTDGLDQLSRGYFRNYPGISGPAISRARRLSFLDRPGEQTLSEAAYKYVLANPAVSTVIGGFSRVAHIQEATRVSNGSPLASTDLQAIEQLHQQGIPAG